MSEVMDCFDFSQLQPNESADQCGFAATALCFAAGQPGHGPRQPVQWAIERMAAWYTEFDGPDIPSNTRGMELWQLYKLITEKGGHYQSIDVNATAIASWIAAKYPVIVAVTEGSVYDVHLGGSPYTWDTSGLSHMFTVTGIDHDHIFLCRDTVNQHSGSPYSYDGDKLSCISATVFVPDWMPRPTGAIAPTTEEYMTIDITTPVIAAYYKQVDATHWQCLKNGYILKGDNLKWYCTNGTIPYCGFSSMGLIQSNEIPIEQIGPELGFPFAHLAGHGIVVQFGERQVICYDQHHLVDNPDGAGATYPLQLYNPKSPGPGTDPAIWGLLKSLNDAKQQEVALQAQLTALQTQQQSSIPDPRIAAYQSQLITVNGLAQQIVKASIVTS